MTASRAPPFVTALTIACCCLIQAYVYAFDVPLSGFAFSTKRIVNEKEFYRLLTSPFLHGSGMHLTMNMLSTYYLQGHLEAIHGSLPILYLTLLSILSNAAVFMSLAFFFHFLFRFDDPLLESAIGYSGVIFTHITLAYRNRSSASVYGQFSVPGWTYPW